MVKNVAKPPRISRPNVDPRSEILKYRSTDMSPTPRHLMIGVRMLAGLFPCSTGFRFSPCYGIGFGGPAAHPSTASPRTVGTAGYREARTTAPDRAPPQQVREAHRVCGYGEGGRPREEEAAQPAEERDDGEVRTAGEHSAA